MTHRCGAAAENGIMESAELFEKIVREHYEPLYRFALSLTRAESDAQDLTQHTFYVWATKGHQLRDQSKVKTWLFTTLHREFLMSRRRHGRFPHYELDEVGSELPVALPNAADRVDSSEVLLALTRLDEIHQAAVSLFYLQDFSYQEIATILEIPIGTVKSRLARGIRHLKELMTSDPRSPANANPCALAEDAPSAPACASTLPSTFTS